MIISPDSYLYDPAGTYHWTVQGVRRAWELAGHDFDEALSRGPSKVVLLTGLPGAGKSTWLKERGDEEALYFDATFDLPVKRKPWLDKARAAGIPVEIVWVDTPLEVCIERNSDDPYLGRSEDRRVPEAVIRNMHGRLQRVPPSESEGATVTVVRSIDTAYPTMSVRVVNQLQIRGVSYVSDLDTITNEDLRSWGFLPKMIKEINSIHPLPEAR